MKNIASFDENQHLNKVELLFDDGSGYQTFATALFEYNQGQI